MPKVLIIFLVLIGAGIVITIGTFVFLGGPTNIQPSGKTTTQSGTVIDQSRVPMVYVSHDGGTTWQGLDGTRGLDVAVMEIKHGNADQLYFGTRGKGLWLSVDGGKTTTQVVDPKGIVAPTSDISAIAQSADGSVLALGLFVKNFGRLVRLYEGGAQELYRNPLERFGLFGVVMSQTDDRHMYIASGDGTIVETSDGGKTWDPIARAKDGFVHLVANIERPATMVGIGKKNGLFVTLVGGNQWHQYDNFSLTDGGNAGLVYDIVFARRRGSILAGSDYGLIESFDDGASWQAFQTPVPPRTLPVRAVAAHPRFESVIWMAVGDQVYRTDDGGMSWSTGLLPDGATVTMMRVHETDPKIIYAGISAKP